METILNELFLKGTAQNLFIVRCDDDDNAKRKVSIAKTIVDLGQQRGVPVKEVMEWNTSADVVKRWEAEEEAERAKAKALQEQIESQQDAFSGGGGNTDDDNNTINTAANNNTTNTNTATTIPSSSSSSLMPRNTSNPANPNVKDPVTIAWGQLCKRRLWILCPFGSCSDERLLRSAAVEILCARTYQCHDDFRVVLLCNRREFDRLPRVVRVLSGLKFGHHRYAVIPRTYQPEVVDEPIEEYLDYNAVELAADAPDLANYQEQVFNSDPTIRIVQHDFKRFGRGDLFIRIMRDALKFNLTVHTLDLSKSKGGDVICHCLTSILHTTRKLRHLVLSDCSLTDAGIVELAEAMRKNENVWTLNISKNPQITDVGLVALASIFAPGTKSRLEGLDISFNNLLYDTPKQWSRAALIALWETLPRHPFLKYVSIAGCSLGSHHVIDLCDRWMGRYRKLSYEEWQQENDPDVDYHTAALRRKQQKARRLKLQREQQKMEQALKKAAAELELRQQQQQRRKSSAVSNATNKTTPQNTSVDGDADAQHQHDEDGEVQKKPTTAGEDFEACADELEALESEFLEPWERAKIEEEKALELERMRLENENKLFDSSLVSLNISENTIGDAAIGLLMESLPIGLKRLNIEHVSMGASGFRAVAYALSTLKLQLEELNISHNNSLLLTRRLLMDAEGDDDYVTEAEAERRRKAKTEEAALEEELNSFGLGFLLDKNRKESNSAQQRNMSVISTNGGSHNDQTSPPRYHNDRRIEQLSAWGHPLIFLPPALEDSDWARFYVPPPKTKERGLRDFTSEIGHGDGTDVGTAAACDAVAPAAGGAVTFAEDTAPHGHAGGPTSSQQPQTQSRSASVVSLTQQRNAVPMSTKALFTRLVSPTMVALLQADAVAQSVTVDGWSFPLEGMEGEGEEKAVAADGGDAPAATEQKEEESVTAEGDALPSDGANRADHHDGAEGAAAVVAAAATTKDDSTTTTPFHQREDEGRLVRAAYTTPPRYSAMAALMKALEDNYRLHTLNLSAVHVGEEGLRILVDTIIACRCGVRSLDVSLNGNLGEESSHKIKELIIASGAALQQEQQNQNQGGADDGGGVGVDELLRGATPLVPTAANLVSALKPPRPAAMSGDAIATPAAAAGAAAADVGSADGSAAVSPTAADAPNNEYHRPQTSAALTGGAVGKRVTTPLVADNPRADSPRRIPGRLGGSGSAASGGVGRSNSPLSGGAGANSRPNTSGTTFDDTMSLNSTAILSATSSSAGGASTFGIGGGTLSTISSFFADIEGNVIETDVGVLMHLNLKGNATCIGERALLGMYDNAGLQVLNVEDMGLTDAMLQPLGDACDVSLRRDASALGTGGANISTAPPKRSITGRGVGKGSYDSTQYEDVDPVYGTIAYKLRTVHKVQNFFNPELSLVKVYLGKNTLWRQGVKHLASFIKHSAILQEVHLNDVWGSFIDDLGNVTSLSKTRREGLFFFEPLLEALSGNTYSCALLKSYSTVTTMGGMGGGRANASAASFSRANAYNTNSGLNASSNVTMTGTPSGGKYATGDTAPYANLPGLEGGWNRTDTVRSTNNTWAAVAGRRAMAAAAAEGASSSSFMVGSPAAALRSSAANSAANQQQHMLMSSSTAGSATGGGADTSTTAAGAGGAGLKSLPHPTNYRAPSLRLLDLSRNDIHPIVLLELITALNGNENLTSLILKGNPMIAAGADAEVDYRIAEEDTRFVRD